MPRNSQGASQVRSILQLEGTMGRINNRGGDGRGHIEGRGLGSIKLFEERDTIVETG